MPRSRARWAVASAGVVSAILVLALFHLGSPTNQRLMRLDDQRVSRLKKLRSELETHLQREGELPAALADLAAKPWASPVANDPSTAEPFGYEVVEARRYRLCATFDRASPAPPTDLEQDFWTHPAGTHCYDIVVDDPASRQPKSSPCAPTTAEPQPSPP